MTDSSKEGEGLWMRGCMIRIACDSETKDRFRWHSDKLEISQSLMGLLIVKSALADEDGLYELVLNREDPSRRTRDSYKPQDPRTYVPPPVMKRKIVEVPIASTGSLCRSILDIDQDEELNQVAACIVARREELDRRVMQMVDGTTLTTISDAST